LALLVIHSGIIAVDIKSSVLQIDANAVDARNMCPWGEDNLPSRSGRVRI